MWTMPTILGHLLRRVNGKADECAGERPDGDPRDEIRQGLLQVPRAEQEPDGPADRGATSRRDRQQVCERWAADRATPRSRSLLAESARSVLQSAPEASAAVRRLASQWHELSRSSRLAKRTLDLAEAGLLSVLAIPLLMALAVAIKLDSPGPVFFRQERIGRGGARFRLLRLASLDELPHPA
jgi:hypothetical protein